jgi:putative zinc finger/helix-turn-helix YgiT family protein
MNILVFHCSKCGAIVPEIPDAACLHRLILLDVLKKQTLLSGEEIRFIRKMADYSATELAKVMGVTKNAVSRWENDKKPIGKETDRLLRLVCFTKFLERMSGAGKERDLPGDVARVAKLVSSLNITSLLEHIESKMEGSKHIAIDPSRLLGLEKGIYMPPTTGDTRIQ